MRADLRRLGGCKPKSSEMRFWSSLRMDESGCWLWLGRPQGSNGYGRIKHNGKAVQAHRFSWELHFGQIPGGLLVCHRCDVPLCVNPSHLFLGTHQDNAMDKITKGRKGDCGTKTPLRGSSNGNSKLSDEQVSAIRSDPRPQRAIARDHGVSQTLVHRIKSGYTWRHIA